MPDNKSAIDSAAVALALADILSKRHAWFDTTFPEDDDLKEKVTELQAERAQAWARARAAQNVAVIKWRERRRHVETIGDAAAIDLGILTAMNVNLGYKVNRRDFDPAQLWSLTNCRAGYHCNSTDDVMALLYDEAAALCDGLNAHCEFDDYVLVPAP